MYSILWISIDLNAVMNDKCAFRQSDGDDLIQLAFWSAAIDHSLSLDFLFSFT